MQSGLNPKTHRRCCARIAALGPGLQSIAQGQPSTDGFSLSVPPPGVHWMSSLFRFTIFALAFAMASSASARTELNLAGALPPEQTALVRVDLGKTNLFAPSALTWLLYITDLSKPGAEPVKLYSKMTARAGHDPRVAPGRYRLSIGCSVPGAFGGSFGKQFEAEIDAKAGHTYVVHCTGRRARSMNYTVREVGSGQALAEDAGAADEGSPAADDAAPAADAAEEVEGTEGAEPAKAAEAAEAAEPQEAAEAAAPQEVASPASPPAENGG
jgi:hypothetical protein